MAVLIGRCVDDANAILAQVDEQGGGRRVLRGTLTAPDPTAAEASNIVAAARRNLEQLSPGTIVPITHTGDPNIDGYYEVLAASVGHGPGGVAARFYRWAITAQRIGASDVMWDTLLGGADLPNGGSHNVTPTTFLGLPAIDTFEPEPSADFVQRTDADGDTVWVATGIARDTTHRFSVAPDEWYLGAAEVAWAEVEDGTRYLRHGREVPRLPRGSWEIGNGLVRAVALASHDAGFTFGGWDGTTWDEWDFNLTKNGATQTTIPLFALGHPTIVRNDAEWAILRIDQRVSAAKGGRVTLDLGVRRGSRFVYGTLYHTTATELGIVRTGTGAPDAATDRADGSVEDTGSADRWFVVTDQARTADTTNGR